jgi:hypothetical protein
MRALMIEGIRNVDGGQALACLAMAVGISKEVEK